MKTFIIAEVSANHGQSFERAAEMIKVAKLCGADAVKFQAYTPDTMTIDCNNEYFQIEHPEWGGQTLYQLYKKAYTPWEWFPKLKKIANDEGIIFFATAFDYSSVDMLEGIGVSMHKIASFELVDIPLLKYAASKGKPMIVSTGMASLEEIEDAVDAIRCEGCEDLTLLKCVSCYPSKPEQMNLNAIPFLQETFNCQVGLSDHSLTNEATIASIALGASVIEKHFILDRSQKTPDCFFSLESQEFKAMVNAVRTIESALGNGVIQIDDAESKSRIFRRSLFVVEDIKKGEKVTGKNISSIRPGYGLKPKYFGEIFGKRVLRDVKRGEPLSWDIFETGNITE